MTTSGEEPQVPLVPPSPYAPPTPPVAPPLSYPPPPPPTAPYGQPPYPPASYAQNPYAQPFGYGMVAPAGPVSGAARMLGWLILAMGALVVVGAFMPWVSAGPFSVSGIGGSGAEPKDGVITLPLGLVASGLGLARALSSKRGAIHLVAGIVSLIAGLLIALIALVDILDINRIGYGISLGVGIVLTMIAGALLIIVSIAAIVKRA